MIEVQSRIIKVRTHLNHISAWTYPFDLVLVKDLNYR